MLEMKRASIKTREPAPQRPKKSLRPEFQSLWSLGLSPQVNLGARGQLPLIVAVGGGKGGVGKSVLSANLAARYGQQGLRVLVIDLDLGCSNLHTHYGASHPKKNLGDLVLKNRLSFRDLILPAPVQGVGFIAGGREEEWAEILSGETTRLGSLYEGILSSKQELGVDVVILDLGAGTHRHTMDFFLLAHMGAVTVLPEPTSIENAYVFLRASLWQLISNLGVALHEQDAAEDIKTALANVGRQGTLDQGYVDCFRSLSGYYPTFIQSLAGALRGRHMGLVINQARSQADMDIGKSMEHICQKYFGFQSIFLGALNYDESVWKSLRNRRLLVSDFPHSLISKRIQVVANQILTVFGMHEG